MIKIVKDTNVKVVTKGAYENFYKPLGYTIMDDVKKAFKDVFKSEKEKEGLDKDLFKDNGKQTNNKRK